MYVLLGVSASAIVLVIFIAYYTKPTNVSSSISAARLQKGSVQIDKWQGKSVLLSAR